MEEINRQLKERKTKEEKTKSKGCRKDYEHERNNNKEEKVMIIVRIQLNILKKP